MPILDQFGRPLPSAAGRAVISMRRARRAAIEAQYDAAQTTKENAKHWRWADNLSAAQANSPDVRRTIRERARYEIANNSFAAGIVDTLANDTIGTGPRLQLQTEDPHANRVIEQRWRSWCRASGLAAKLRTARRAKVGDGEAFLLRTNNPRLATQVKLDIRTVECDLFEDPTETGTSPKHVSGVHFDDDMLPIAYDKLEYHPGDVHGHEITPKRVDADELIHLFRADRPGQIRGVSEIVAALPLFAMLRRFTLAVLLAAETAADFAAILETQSSPFDEDNSWDGDEVDPFEGVEIDRGMMAALPRGWKMNQFKAEQPVTGYLEFRNAILNEIARCVHMPANKARADSSGYNYASGRLDHGTYYEAIDVERDQWAGEVLDRVFAWWFDEAILIPGYLPQLPAFAEEIPRQWYWPGHKHSDPTKEANAVATLHSLGLITDEQYLLSEGTDPERHFEQLQRQRDRRQELGLPAFGGGQMSPVENENKKGDDEESSPADKTEKAAA